MLQVLFLIFGCTQLLAGVLSVAIPVFHIHIRSSYRSNDKKSERQLEREEAFRVQQAVVARRKNNSWQKVEQLYPLLETLEGDTSGLASAAFHC